MCKKASYTEDELLYLFRASATENDLKTLHYIKRKFEGQIMETPPEIPERNFDGNPVDDESGFDFTLNSIIKDGSGTGSYFESDEFLELQKEIKKCYNKNKKPERENPVRNILQGT